MSETTIDLSSIGIYVSQEYVFFGGQGNPLDIKVEEGKVTLDVEKGTVKMKLNLSENEFTGAKTYTLIFYGESDPDGLKDVFPLKLNLDKKQYDVFKALYEDVIKQIREQKKDKESGFRAWTMDAEKVLKVLIPENSEELTKMQRAIEPLSQYFQKNAKTQGDTLKR